MSEIKKIVELNKILKEKLDFEKIKSYHNYDMIFKICDTILKKYKINFAISLTHIDNNQYKKYIDTVAKYIEVNIFNNEELDIKQILGLHNIIMSSLTTTEKIKKTDIGIFRNRTKYIDGLTLYYKRKRIGFVSPKFVKKESKILLLDLKKYIDNKKEFEGIIKYILYNLVKIHPFENGNAKTFFILLDTLLWKYDFFPCFIKDKRFDEKLQHIFQIYTTNQNFQQLYINFVKEVISIYKNYQM